MTDYFIQPKGENKIEHKPHNSKKEKKNKKKHNP